MRRLCFVLISLCFLVLEGCAPKTAFPPAAVPRFPDQPLLSLTKTPEQSLPGEPGRQAFAIRGGWGFKQADAVILSVPAGSRQKEYANTVPLERQLVLARNEVEFSSTPAQGRRYAVVDYGTISRTLGTRNGRMYALWRGQARLVSEAETPALYQEAMRRPLSKRTMPATPNVRSVSREYWFDITDTSGGNSFAGRKGAVAAR